jgi:2,5-dihydroxypyridine 5,6-dioxygenase
MSKLEIFKKVLSHCAVKEGEKAVVLEVMSGPPVDRETSTSLLHALEDFGAEYSMVLVPQKTTDYHRDMLKQADIVFKLGGTPGTGFSIYNSRDVKGILNSGTRVLTISNYMLTDEATLRRLLPTEDHIRRTFEGAERLKKAETIKVTSPAGTNLTMNKLGRPAHRQCGAANEAGIWDSYGFGLVMCCPLENSANGTLVIDVGDLFNSPRLYVTELVRCAVKDGYITKIEGGFSAKFLDKWLSSWNDEESYGISHIGWGTHRGAIWWGTPWVGTDWYKQGITGADIESYYGNMLIAFGASPSFPEPAGTRAAPSHIDIGMLNCDFILDDELITSKGKIMPEYLE